MSVKKKKPARGGGTSSTGTKAQPTRPKRRKGKK